jgi:hypothetical protein
MSAWRLAMSTSMPDIELRYSRGAYGVRGEAVKRARRLAFLIAGWRRLRVTQQADEQNVRRSLCTGI